MDVTRETILVIEDDAAIREGLELNLRLEGYRVLCAGEAARGLELARAHCPELILLDLMLPDGSGLKLLTSLRRDERLVGVQVLILSALGLEADKVRGLRLGADDYITKPFSLGELLARIHAALRRTRLQRQTAMHFGEVEIDPARPEVRRCGQPVKLTHRELELLLFLVRHPGQAFSREQLLHSVWGADYDGTARTVDNFIRALRSKLEPDPMSPVHLTTVHGVGYRFDPLT